VLGGIRGKVERPRVKSPATSRSKSARWCFCQ
jgi:hypothetical protein